MATMKDVAKLAKVSTSTVSHVINQSRFVSDEIALRVKSAAKELNYTPSALARSLKMNSTKTIGMLVSNSTNPFFGELLKGVERRCYEQGYTVIVCNTEGDDKRMRSSISTLLQKRVDGLILMCSTLEGDHLGIFDHYPNLPIVVMDWGPMLFASDKIQDNSYLGGYLATNHLIKQGHREIGCITGPLDQHQALLRFNGYQKAMLENKISIEQQWIIEGDFHCQSGKDAFYKLLDTKHLPTGLFISNDMMAMGIMNAAIEHGLTLPTDLSLVGYDDIQIAQYMNPPLTTIHQPKHRLGVAAVDTLLARMEQPNLPAKMVQLEPSLIQRKSVHCLL